MTARSITGRTLAALGLGALLAGCTIATWLPGRGVSGCGGGDPAPAGGVIPSAACSSGPMTTDPPYPVDRKAALATATGFVGSDPMVRFAESGAPAWAFVGPKAAVVVDAASGQLVEVITLAPIIDPAWNEVVPWSRPADPSPAPVPDAPTSIHVAQSWTAAHAFGPTTTTGTAEAYAVGGARGWRVILATTTGSSVEVLVTRAGAITAAVVHGTALALSAPPVDRDSAIALALAFAAGRTKAEGQAVRSAWFDLRLLAAGVQPVWEVNTAVEAAPDPTSGDLNWDQGLAMNVSALDGSIEVTGGQ